MTDSFANIYWSSDYVSGIESLKSQSNISLKQLHQLRQLVFKAMNYYHANSQYLQQFAQETSETSFDVLRVAQNLPVLERRTVSQAYKKLEDMRQNAPGSRTVDPHKSKETDSETVTETRSDITMDLLISTYIKEFTAEAMTLLSLASTVDREVLEPINDFIKHHESSIRGTVDRFDKLISDYMQTYGDVEKLKSEYSECRRAKEFADSNALQKHKNTDTEAVSADSSLEEVDSESSMTLNDTSIEEEPQSSLDSEFDFPLFVGPVKLRSQKELSAFLKDALSKIETTKRSFPLPGQKPNVFSSDDLCKFLVYRRPFKLNPTRLNLERFGQGLMDLKLITATCLISGKKFRSENMWFEWSDLATYISSYETADKSLPATPNSKPRQRLVDENTAKQVNEMASQTGKKFNEMIQSMKFSILHTNHEERLLKIEQQYKEKYYDLHELKFLIDSEVIERSQYLEKFEKMKIGLIYKSLTKLLEIIYNFSLDSTTRLHASASSIIKDINKEEHYVNDFKKLMNTFSTGIYCPSILSPENFQKKQYITTQANNNFQNLKLQFNLYKDIPLQLQISQTDKENKLLSFASLSFFLYQLTKVIEEQSKRLEDLQEHWESPINHQRYWMLKEKVISTVNEQAPDLNATNENSLLQILIEKIIDLFRQQDLFVLVNFYKNWLLEIGDSLIPCLIYDSLIQLYVKQSSPERPEIIKILSTIPRSNISSLVYLFEHISSVYNLSQIPSFGLYDEFPEELKMTDEKATLEEVATKLNDMNAIGSVPFLHLIFRPSPIKSAGGLKPPLQIYDKILESLLDIELRCDLFNHLVNSEKNYLEKKQQEKSNLGLQKKVPIPSSPRRPFSSSDLKSPRALPASDSFSLRPFHTKVTPAPSPSASPRHLSREMYLSDSTPSQRERSTSGTFMAPTIDIEFAKP